MRMNIGLSEVYVNIIYANQFTLSMLIILNANYYSENMILHCLLSVIVYPADLRLLQIVFVYS
jgi:hypothetical protein